MADTADDLSAPLGQDTVRRKRRFRLPFTGIQALAVLLGLFLLAFAGFAIFGDNPLGGEPVARIAIRQNAPSGEKAVTAAPGDHAGSAKSAPQQAA
ncbi:MAG: divergent polysaccharide deacetylase family protein, partial [Bradyrhizobium sp.]